MTYHDQQALLLKEASQSLARGEEPASHLYSMLDPDTMMRLRVFTRDLPDLVRELTIFGRANKPAYSKKKK